jgi:dihydrofolate synthase/folylpolyglutamate synthase
MLHSYEVVRGSGFWVLGSRPRSMLRSYGVMLYGLCSMVCALHTPRLTSAAPASTIARTGERGVATVTITTYQEALDFLYRFFDPARRPAATLEAAARNVERMRALLAAAGDPQLCVPSVVVAGTKGKGSTCAMIERIARQAGYRTGLWSSPHLNSYRERIQIDRALISQQELVDLVRETQPVLEAFDTAHYGSPSVFDVGFVLALRHFAAQQVQLAVLEIGLGGRYDSVNAVTPLVSLITSISYDHMHVLGATLTEIADNKAGIIKTGVPVVSAPQHPEAAAVIERVAQELGVPLYVGVGEFRIQESEFSSGDEDGFSAAARRFPVALPSLSLRGAFQRENAALAACATQLLSERGFPTITRSAIATALGDVSWPGRLEAVGQAPLLVLDGAHNGDSARKLAAALRQEFQFERLILILGTSRDKTIHDIAAALVPGAAMTVLTRSTHPRAMDVDRLLAAVEPHRAGEIHLTGDVVAAITQARTLATPADLICVTGSLFVVGDARAALGLALSD